MVVSTYIFFAFNAVAQPQPTVLLPAFVFSPRWGQTISTSFAMIRRNPTLIPMNDLDVQDIRDMVAKQKADQQLMQKMKRLVESPEILKEDFDLMAELSGSIKDKVRRMGLDAGTTPLPIDGFTVTKAQA